MVYSKEDFKRLWEANDYGSGITDNDIADCAKAWGISYITIDDIRYRVLKAAQVNDAEDFNPNPTSQCACNEISDHLTGNHINWEQRRYEIARTMLPTMFELALNERKERNGCGWVLPQSICKAAIRYADELINQLKPKGGFQD